MSNITIVEHIRHHEDAISIEEAQRRKERRRRRVAKRMYHRFPLFAVEFMQPEFGGYTYEDFVADVTRKTRKGKKMRRPKKKAFDWKEIRRSIPDFFQACKKRTPTTAVLHGKLKDGIRFTCTVHSVYWDGQGQRLFDTYQLIKLWKENDLKKFCSHSAVLLEEHKDTFTIQTATQT